MTRPIAIKGYKLKDGKLVKVSTARSVSDKIRERKSKRVKVAPATSMIYCENGD